MTDSKTKWKRVQVNWYGGKKQDIEIATGKSLWHRVGLDPVPIRWVLVREVDGSFDSLPLFSSNQNNSAIQIVQSFVLRWNIKVTFQELRAHLGFGTQRHWSDKAIERTIPCLFGLFSVVVLIALKLHPQTLPVSTSAWYNKSEPTESSSCRCTKQPLVLLPIREIPPKPQHASNSCLPHHTFASNCPTSSLNPLISI